MSLETEIPEVLFTEMKDFIESSSDLDRKKFINSALTDFLFQNGELPYDKMDNGILHEMFSHLAHLRDI